MANEHTYLVIVDADVGLHHGIWDVIFVADIVVQKIEYHDGIIHRSLTISFSSKAIVVIPWFDGLDQFICSMIEWQDACVIVKHLSYLFFCKARHLIEFGSQRVISANIAADLKNSLAE